ncbi:hypothetical protein Tco_0604421 [Tanacetum coccineum]
MEFVMTKERISAALVIGTCRVDKGFAVMMVSRCEVELPNEVLNNLGVLFRIHPLHNMEFIIKVAQPHVKIRGLLERWLNIKMHILLRSMKLVIDIARKTCTDISKITRKSSKTGKHEHGKRKSTKEAKDSEAKPRKVNSTKGQNPKLPFQSLKFPKTSQRIATLAIRVIPKKDPTALNHLPMIEWLNGGDSKERVQQGTA